jgi:hypothetical protein
MKLSTNLVVDSLQDVAEPARKIEAMGFESLYISERKHEPFMQLAVAAVNTERIKIGPEAASPDRGRFRNHGVGRTQLGHSSFTVGQAVQTNSSGGSDLKPRGPSWRGLASRSAGSASAADLELRETADRSAGTSFLTA